jgi:hypothetical protein
MPAPGDFTEDGHGIEPVCKLSALSQNKMLKAEG